MIIKMLQGIIDVLIKFLNFLVGLLPKSPFSAHWGALVLDNNLLSALSWIVPFKSILALSTAWLGAISLYYIYSIGLRWVKAIE